MNAKVLEIQPLALKQRLDDGEDICLIDVRENWEHSLAALPGSTHIPLGELVDRVQELLFEENIVVYCHVGERSHRGAIILMESGFKNVHNLIGGIDGWSQVVDASVPRYLASG
jgi:rhodanese-related sulfurtransferase